MPFVDEITMDTPVSILTVGQLCEIFGMTFPIKVDAHQVAKKNIVRGYIGLMEAMNVGRTTVADWVASGKIEEATTREGRKIWFDVDKVRELLGRKSGGRK